MTPVRQNLTLIAVHRVIRHPSYLGLLVNSLGWVLAFRAGVGPLVSALMIPPLLRAHPRGGEAAARTVRR
jgi:protein-S-isoprenylcysteine O-methyltransferase Ste14